MEIINREKKKKVMQLRRHESKEEWVGKRSQSDGVAVLLVGPVLLTFICLSHPTVHPHIHLVESDSHNYCTLFSAPCLYPFIRPSFSFSFSFFFPKLINFNVS